MLFSVGFSLFPTAARYTAIWDGRRGKGCWTDTRILGGAT